MSKLLKKELNNNKLILRDLVYRLRVNPLKVEIRNADNFQICVCKCDSEGVLPYLDREVLQWFPTQHSVIKESDFVVLIKDADKEPDGEDLG